MRADHKPKHAVGNTVNYKARLNPVLHCTGIVFHTVKSILDSRPSPQTVSQLGYSEAQGLAVPQGLRDWLSLRGSTYSSGSAGDLK